MENWVDFKTIKAAVTIRQVLAHYNVNLAGGGKELRGRCPIHKGQGAESFHVSTEKNAFHCFSCQAKGNVLDFVAAMENCNIRDAGLKLQEWFGLRVGDGAGLATPSTDVLATPENKLAGEDKAGKKNPLQGENTNGGHQEPNKPLTFTLQGIVHDYLYLDNRGITKETAEHFGVGFFPGRGSMSLRVVIPIHNQLAELVAYAGRSVDGREPRYKLPAGFHKSLELYNFHRAIAAGQRGLIVVEGFFDAMKVHQAGFPFVVALMGCSMSEEQERLLVAHADMVILMLDGDEAGRQGTDEILLRLGRRVWTKVISLVGGMQPDQMSDKEIQEVLGK